LCSGGLSIRVRGGWEPIDLVAERFPISQLRHFFETLHTAVLTAGGGGASDSSREGTHRQQNQDPPPPPPPEEEFDHPPPPPDDEDDEERAKEGAEKEGGDENPLGALDEAYLTVSSRDGMEVVGLTRDHLVRVKVRYPEPKNGTTALARDHFARVEVT
jgi:hypothetical protein